MKNQYFGDENDYRKYGLLRVLTNRGSLGTGVCWMLTDSDGRNDGGRISYLTNPSKWQQHDPNLYDALVQIVRIDRCRDVARANDPSILRGMIFHSSIVGNSREERQKYFQETTHRFKGLDLIFFDPDNGIEVRSTPYGRKGSSKYIYLTELKDAFNAGHSLLIYQHFPRVKRIPYIYQRTRELTEQLSSNYIMAFKTPYVVFFLVSQDRHKEYFRQRLPYLEKIWEKQIRIINSQGV